MKYKKQIDGLRALAVMSVIFFHADVIGFAGGYVGVDIFFVISGYLITSLILQQMQDRTFSLSAFWERRARRILPALFFVIFCCLPVAWIFLLPYDMQRFSGALITIPFFLQNFYFWRNNTYFEPSTDFSPLVHTWSLAVEEQYYLLFPFFLLWTRRCKKTTLLWLILFIALIGLLMLQSVFVEKLSFKFFMLPTRGWEILIGAAVACYALDSNNKNELSIRSAELLSAAGLLLILYSIISFDKNTVFPGWATLVPTLGTGLILLGVEQRTFVSRLFELKPLTAIGLVSYGAYLWHQPLLAFSRHISVDEPSRFVTSLLALASLIFGWVSYKFVEQPFRRQGLISTKGLVIVVLCSSLGLVVFGASGVLTKGFENRFSTQQKELWSYTNYDVGALWRVGQCFLQPEQSYHSFGKDCAGVGDGKPLRAMVWGDSNAAALYPGLKHQFEHVAQYSASGCPPVLSINQTWRPFCKDINRYVFEQIKTLRPERLILFANWILYKDIDMAGELAATLDAIKKELPSTAIEVIGGVPQWYPSLPVYLLKRGLYIDQISAVVNTGLSPIIELDQALATMSETRKVRFHSALDALCNRHACQVATQYQNKQVLTTWDYEHLTEGGSVNLVQKLFGKNR
ncbi:acyltransferase [Alcaligenaceae bacterium LF4-65]|uniref:Acyltransferase n=1 Tax=Zwartia hollandica TaxID=324606 RepID=A0A953T294_9BURK|nr:acyltransferase family protein [Zwartia hollandica]MBZ1350135.1 acyltransferase [Zwartia hollandica]